jgi:hypothetical protein
MAPGGIVEVWMPLPGGGSRQVALLPVAPDGTFDGALPFTGELDGRGPLPIGERTIQLYGTDANGQLTQSVPAPTDPATIGSIAYGQVVQVAGGQIDLSNGMIILFSR